MYVVSGCNGSGKTTASYTALPELFACSQFVNSDEFAKGLSPFRPEDASVTASRMMVMKIKYLMGLRSDFAVETTLATRSLRKIILAARELGYHVTVLYFWLDSKERAIARVRDRVSTGGHNIPDNVIRRRYLMGLQYFFDTYSPICDRWVLADNSQTPFEVVAEGSDHLISIKDNEKFRLIRKLVHPDE